MILLGLSSAIKVSLPSSLLLLVCMMIPSEDEKSLSASRIEF